MKDDRKTKAELIEELDTLRAELASRAGHALPENDIYYRAVVEDQTELICRFHPDGTLTFVNEAYCRYFGTTREDLIGQSFLPLIAKDDRAFVQEQIASLTMEKPTATHEQRVLGPDGTLAWQQWTNRALFDDAGRLAEYQAVGLDITKRKKAEETLELSLSLLKATLESTTDGILVVDPQGKVTSYNQRFLDMWEIPDSLIETKDDDTLLDHVMDRLKAPQEFLGKVRELYAHPDRDSFDVIEFADGRTFERYSHAQEVKGKILGRVWSFRDITQRKWAEDGLRDSEALYTSLVENLPLHIFRKGLDERFTFGNGSFCTTLNRPLEAIVGKTDFDFYAPELAAKYQQDDRAVMTTGQRIHLVEKHPGPDGEIAYVEVFKTPLYDASGTIIGIQGLFWDITASQRAEEAIKESEERLRALFEGIDDAIFVHDESGRILDCNEAACRRLEYTREELLAMTTREIDDPEFAKGFQERFEQQQQEGRHTCEGIHVAKSGRRIPVDINTSTLLYKGRKVVLALMRDITERKQAEHALQESERRFKELADLLPQTVFEMDGGGAFTFGNRFGLQAFGYTEEEFALGLSVLNVLAPEDRERALDNVVRIGRGEDLSGVEYTAVRKDGTTFPVLIYSSAIMKDGQYAGLRGFIIDITERKQTEEDRRKLEHQIQQAQKLESLGVLAGGIAHDFNNLLTGILGRSGMALAQLPEDSPVRKNVQHIETTALRAAELSRQMLAYSGRGKFVVQMIHLSEVVEEMAHLLDVSIGKKCVLKFNFANDLSAVEGDITQIRQVIMNLIINASEAIGEHSGIITVSTGMKYCDRDFLAESYLDNALPDGQYVYVEVSDTGCGMTPETRAKLFEPFFSTKFTGRGLGLAAVLGVIRGHGGAIKVYSEVGRGTTFRVYLPASEKSAPAQQAPPRAMESWHGTGTILVVDDERTVRELTQEVFEDAGFTVLVASDGVDGVEMFRTHADEISVVILDLTMPRMDGEEAFSEIRKIRKDACVILSSGYNESDATDRFSGQGLAGFIQKPYRVDELLDALRQVLQRPSEPGDGTPA